MLSVEEFARQNAESRKSTSFLLTVKAASPQIQSSDITCRVTAGVGGGYCQ